MDKQKLSGGGIMASMNDRKFLTSSFITILLVMLAFAVNGLVQPRYVAQVVNPGPLASNLAAVPNFGAGGSVTIFDTRNNTVVANVDVPPGAALAAMYGKYAYIGSVEPDPIISKIDLATRQVVAQVQLPKRDNYDQFVELEMAPGGRMLIAASAYHATLYFIRPSDLTLFYTLPLYETATSTPPMPESIPVVNFSADGSKLYAAYPANNAIVSIDLNADPPQVLDINMAVSDDPYDGYRDFKRSIAESNRFFLLVARRLRYKGGEKQVIVDFIPGTGTVIRKYNSDFPTDIESTVMGDPPGEHLLTGSNDYEEGSVFYPRDKVRIFFGSTTSMDISTDVSSSESAASITRVGDTLWSVCSTREIVKRDGNSMKLCDPASIDVFGLQNGTTTKLTTILLPSQSNLTQKRLPAVDKTQTYFYQPLDGDNILVYNLAAGYFSKIKVGPDPRGVYLAGDTSPKEYLFPRAGSRPHPPVDISAAAVSNTSILLTWIDVGTEGDYGYVIERRQQGEESFREIFLTWPDATNYTDSGLNTLTTYCYRIFGYNGWGESYYGTNDDGNQDFDCATTPP